MKNCLDHKFEKLPKQTRSRINPGYRRLQDTNIFQQVVGFTCMVCHLPINSDPLLSGVNNRNHCPYCLSSRHVDLYQAGDRMNACRASMQAIGLSWKSSRNKYGTANGELMIVHLCNECNAVSINRIAADDNLDKLVNLFEETIRMEISRKEKLCKNGILMLEYYHHPEFKQCLFGKT